MRGEMKRDLYVCLICVDSNIGDERSVCLESNMLFEMKGCQSVSHIDFNIRDDSLSDLLGFQYVVWNETQFDRLHVLLGFQYEGWNEP